MTVHPMQLARTARDVRATLVADDVPGLGAERFLRRAMRALDRVVPFGAGAFATVDPDTLLWTGCVLRGLPAAAAAAFSELALEPDGYDARRRALHRPHGMAHELRVSFACGGRCFGSASLLRAEGAPAFTSTDARVIERLAGDVAEGLRTAPAAARAGAAGRWGAGVLVVDDRSDVLSVTDDATVWLEELGGDVDGTLPAVVHAVVAAARRREAGLQGPPARARLTTPSGTWLTVSASALSGDERAWAVVLEPSRPGDVLALMAEANDLTAREREVLGMLVRGAPDKLVAAQLAVSPHTAREHTGRILRKFGVRTRGELQANLFGAHGESWLAA